MRIRIAVVVSADCPIMFIMPAEYFHASANCPVVEFDAACA